jgi:hypothetical protein
MQGSRRRFVSSLAAASAFGASGVARACGFDGIFDGGFGTIHPRAIEIALAVRRAVADGLLPQSALGPLVPGEASLWHATEILKRLGRRLSATKVTGLRPPDMALLCSDASLWTRYVANARSFETVVHADKPALSDAVVVADLAVVAAVTDGHLPVGSAVARGLLVIEASRGDADAVEALLTAACDKAASTALDLADRMPWGPQGLRQEP